MSLSTSKKIQDLEKEVEGLKEEVKLISLLYRNLTEHHDRYHSKCGEERR